MVGYSETLRRQMILPYECSKFPKTGFSANALCWLRSTSYAGVIGCLVTIGHRARSCVANAFLTVTFKLHIRFRYRQLVRSTFSRERRRRNTRRDRFGRAVFSCSGETSRARAARLPDRRPTSHPAMANEVAENPDSLAQLDRFRISRNLEAWHCQRSWNVPWVPWRLINN
jgi:hypothetical protein